MAAQSTTWACGRSLPGITVSNPAGGRLSLVNVLCCQVWVSATDWSLVQRSPSKCGVSEYDREALIMRAQSTIGLLFHKGINIGNRL